MKDKGKLTKTPGKGLNTIVLLALSSITARSMDLFRRPSASAACLHSPSSLSSELSVEERPDELQTSQQSQRSVSWGKGLSAPRIKPTFSVTFPVGCTATELQLEFIMHMMSPQHWWQPSGSIIQYCTLHRKGTSNCSSFFIIWMQFLIYHNNRLLIITWCIVLLCLLSNVIYRHSILSVCPAASNILYNVL